MTLNTLVMSIYDIKNTDSVLYITYEIIVICFHYGMCACMYIFIHEDNYV